MLSELAQEAHVVVVEEAQIVKIIGEHGDALHAKTEGEPLVLLRVVAAHLEHFWVYRAGA